MDKVFKEGKYKITPMNVSHINEVAQIEQVSFPTPWSKEAFNTGVELVETFGDKSDSK
jgi:hypothetical protein